ncbi:MAG: HesA/MoeB/ThiF family protein, partial [Muribaculaceae bacterium]|nr:HesA/MoeB/ThiF family protein [Muribaculaceae bacterium]
PERDALCALPAARGGVLGAVPGVVGSLQAAEVLKLIIGMPSLEGMLTIDLRSMEFNNIKF